MLLAVSLAILAHVPFESATLAVPAMRIESVIDKGAVNEIIVACEGGQAIISHAKRERRFCTPMQVCFDDLPSALRSACRR